MFVDKLVIQFYLSPGERELADAESEAERPQEIVQHIINNQRRFGPKLLNEMKEKLIDMSTEHLSKGGKK